MADRIVVGCKCNTRNRIELTPHQFKYINRILAISGFDNVDWKTGLKIYECYQIAHNINQSIEHGRILEPRNSRSPLPFLVNDTINVDLHFTPISQHSRELIINFMRLMRKSLGIQVHESR